MSMESPGRVRLATLADVPALVAMGRTFLAALYAGVLADNPEALGALASQLITREDAVVYVADQPVHGVIGMIAMMLYPHPMSGERVASEIFWWVSPTHRGCGMRLLRQAQAWAIARDAQLLQMIAPTPDVAAFYTRLGFEPVETTFFKRLA
jgi:GNAT superfamily N-acetyltransferase